MRISDWSSDVCSSDLFGRFYRWFARSRYADNTLLIFTSDHAHYPEPSYVQVARDERTGDDGYDPYFVDRIPMFVRAPWLEMPARFDAHDRTSPGLAPTVLSLLGIVREIGRAHVELQSLMRT